jgi:hypothetical protein
MRAADGGYAPRFSGICLALSFSRFGGQTTLPPTAANANRWALDFCKTLDITICCVKNR